MLCVSLGSISFEECLKAVKKYELCELRLDRLKLKDKELEKVISAGKKILVTYRPVKKITDDQRVKKLKAAMDMGAAYVDIEVESEDLFKNEITIYASKRKTKIIVSYHNHAKTPQKSELEHIVEWCKGSSPDIIKIACKSNSNRDNARLLGLLDSDFKMIVIGMGPKGTITRVFAPKLGAFCSYATLSEGLKTAPGQLTEKELEKFLSGLYYV